MVLGTKVTGKETTYTKELFDKAISEGKVVVVSSWIKYCTSCASQMKVLEKVSTIGKEKKQNPRLQVNSVDEYIEIMNNLDLKKPTELETNVARNINLGG